MALFAFFSLFTLLASLIFVWVRRRYSIFNELGFSHEDPKFPVGNLKGIGKEFHPVQV